MSGIVRRVDGLGRVVIPKEIRKVLKIKENEQVEINVVDDTITLNKYTDIHENDKSIINLINSLKDIFNKDIIITSLSKIVLATKDYKDYLDLELSPYLVNIIENRKDIDELLPVSLSLSNLKESIKVAFSIRTLIINGDTIGLVILLTNYSLENSDLKVLDFLNNYLENYLE